MIGTTAASDLPRKRLRPCALFNLLLVVVVAGSSGLVRAQTEVEAALAWARANAIPLSSAEPGSGFDDLRSLQPLIGSARLVALGEAVHAAHEFPALRNRMFEFLVEEQGFTAIAVETGFTEALAIDEYVRGESDDRDVARFVFHWMPDLWAENLWLIDWIREYNARPSTSRKIRFYGIDLSGGRRGLFRQSRIAADGALTYLESIDPDRAARLGATLAPLLPEFHERRYSSLADEERMTLTSGLGDLLDVFERQGATPIAATARGDHEVAHRQAFDALQVDAFLRARMEDPEDWRAATSLRDETMASHLEWVLQREGDSGRVLLFAHNWHVKTATMWPDAYPENYPNGPPTSMGELLRASLGDQMMVIGTLFGGGEGALDGEYDVAEPDSINGLLANLGSPLFAVRLDASMMTSAVPEAIGGYRRIRMNDRYGELEVIGAFDGLIYVEELTPVKVVAREGSE